MGTGRSPSLSAQIVVDRAEYPEPGHRKRVIKGKVQEEFKH